MQIAPTRTRRSDYREKLHQHFKQGRANSIDLLDSLEFNPDAYRSRPLPQHGDTWGRFQYDARNQALNFTHDNGAVM